MPSVLITGAGRGIGLEFARRYAGAGWRVLATARDDEALDRLRALGGNVEARPLDVTDFTAIEALARTWGDENVDFLISNAGIYGPRASVFGSIEFDAWRQVLAVNTLAPVRLAECFLPHVARSDRRVMAFLSSKMGSIADNGSGGQYPYRTSKTALNMAVRSMALDLAPRGITCLALHPGWVRTDMGGPGALIDTTESVTGLCRVIEGAGARESGRFWNYDGTEIPW